MTQRLAPRAVVRFDADRRSSDRSRNENTPHDHRSRGVFGKIASGLSSDRTLPIAVGAGPQFAQR